MFKKLEVKVGHAITKFLHKEGFIRMEHYNGDGGYYTIRAEQPDSKWPISELQFRARVNPHPENGEGLAKLEWRRRHEQLDHTLGEWSDWSPIKIE